MDNFPPIPYIPYEVQRNIRGIEATKSQILQAPDYSLLHLGSGTLGTRTAMGEKVLANLAAYFAGEPLPDRVI